MIISSLVIHPICVIDEYAIIDLILLWFIPIVPPIIELIDAKIIMIFGVQHDCKINAKIVSGPSFCHVDKKRQFIHEIDVITDGNQKWHGAIPNFSKRAEIVIYEDWMLVIGSQNEVEDIKIRLLPSAWIRKYLVEASYS